ncbi:cell division ATP-binding protein FtsE [Thiohalomonas denitrificans]|uniref:cell division ATP-binding protein FtsE n=1 Tax=Thiohalomonas denitrificans TaxID=415747 RepID=UPI0026EE83FD|nr:cell division ATP-binding protein FtsE [Thiohalomonas denitrificans]
MIRFTDVSKRYPGGYEALRGVDFHLAPGEMAFVTGHSGAGKSSLLKLIALIERASSGQVLVGGQNLARVKPRHIPFHRRRIGIIFQEHRLLFDRTVFDNVGLPLIISGHNRSEVERRVRAALDKVGLLDRARSFPVTLSGGEQQRVGIARAVINRPQLVLADEPTGNLDPDLSREIMEIFRDFNRVGVSILVASHDLDLIRKMPHRILRLDQGRLASDIGVTV